MQLTVTAKGQVTLRKEVLEHLGIRSGDKIEVDLLPGNEVKVHAVRPADSISSLFGLLAGKPTVVATLEEMDQAAHEGWAGQR